MLVREIDLFLEYIRNFIYGNERIQGTQQLLGYDYLFRGIVIINWHGSNETTVKYKALNKILVKECVNHYVQMWSLRNERRHSEVIRKDRLLKWALQEKQDPENFMRIETSKYFHAGYDNLEKMSANVIQRWLLELHTIRKSDTVTRSHDIRTFFRPDA